MKSNWSDALLYKPEVNQEDKYSKDNNISERVVIWIEGQEEARFARYHYNINHWSVEGCTNVKQASIKWWQYITNPYS